MDIRDKQSGRRKGKAVYFRVPDEAHKKLVKLARDQHRRSVPDLLYAQALALAEAAR